MSRFLYVTACVVVPLAWGLIVVFFANRLDARMKRNSAEDGGNVIHPKDSTRIEYHI